MPSETSQRPDSSPAVGVLLLLMSTLAVMGSVLLAPVLPLMAAWFADTPGSAVLVPVALVTPALCIALASPFAGMLIEGSAAVLLSRRLAVGAEVRTKPDNLGFAHEDDAWDLFGAWFVNKNVSVTLAYVQLGRVARQNDQGGLYLSLQAGF